MNTDSIPITNPALGESLQGKSGLWFFQTIIPNMIGLIFVIGTLVFLFILIIGAIQWISSGGEKNAMEAARGKIANALIGILILFSAFAILSIIKNFFGLDMLDWKLNINNLFLSNTVK